MKAIQMFFEMLIQYHRLKNELRVSFERVKAQIRIYYIEQVNKANNSSAPIKQLCPKCSGQGIVSKPPYIAGDQNEWTGCEMSYQCNLCKGEMVI